MVASAVPENAKRIMREAGYFQSHIAKKAGISKQTFSNMLNGRKIIADHDVLSLANALGVTPNDLFGIPKEDGVAL